MELAISALLLLVILLPGFIIQTAYTQGFWRWNTPSVNKPLVERIPTAIISAAILHLIWYGIAHFCSDDVINLNTLMMFITGKFGHDDELFPQALTSLSGRPVSIASYFLTLYTFAAVTGLLAHYIVRRTKLDLTTRVLRFNNEWFYWLSGEITEFAETADIGGAIDGIFLTTVVQHSDGDYLYRGFVWDFYFDKDGKLNRVILNNMDRRRLSADYDSSKPDENRFYPIEGDYFILRYSEMVTINLTYISLKEERMPGPIEVNPKR